VVPAEERNPPRVSHRGERCLSATADKPVAQAQPAAKRAPAGGEATPSATETSGVE